MVLFMIIMFQNFVGNLNRLMVIVCSIVQNGVKYQIGVICLGVFSVFVGLKFGFLMNKLLFFGKKNIIMKKMKKNMVIFSRLCMVQYGWNGILFFGMLFLFLFFLMLMLFGLFELILCSVRMCSIIRFSKMIGRVIMCRVKKWFRVILDIRQLL